MGAGAAARSDNGGYMKPVKRIGYVVAVSKLALMSLAVIAAVSITGVGKSVAANLDAPDENITAAVQLIRNGNVQDGYASFLKLAKAGNPHAMYHLGAINHSGILGEPDLDKAVPWYKQSADAGVLEAQFALGSLYYKGKGVSKDLSQALIYFTAAADAGLLAAQYNLAMMHTAGLAHTKNYNADEDRPRAYKWFTIVLARLDPSQDRSPIDDAMELLREEMTSIEIANGEKMAEDWLAANPEVKK